MTTEQTPAAPPRGTPLPPSPGTSPTPPAPAGSKRKRALLIVAAIAVLGGGAWLAYHLLVGRWHENTDDAYVAGNIVTVAPQSTGTVVAINADDGMQVAAGQVVVQLDASDAQVAYDQALANLAGTVRQVRGLYSAVDAGRSDAAAREVAVRQARADVQRRQGLVATGAVSAEELAHARETLAAAEAALASSRGQLSRSRALVDATTLARQPQVQAAASQLRQAWLNLQRATIVAPVGGHVARRSVQLGQRVQAGTPLMTVVPLDQVWVDANFKETQLAGMRIGQPVELHADLYGDDVRFDGRIASLGMGTGSAFSLLPAQNASGNWIKIVQRVPVRIALDPAQVRAHPLRIGLSMHVDVAIQDQSGPVLASVTRAQRPVLATTAYAAQTARVDALIAETIAANLPGAAR